MENEEMTNDAAVDVEPVAWVERTEGGLARMWSGDLSAWAHRPANPEPLYSATTVAELRARIEAAEQKLAEVVEAAIDFLEAADARDNEEVSTQYPDHEKRLRQYKAAREDLMPFCRDRRHDRH